ncbi:hypothetical protein U9M48_038195 [Paspalum notatum var. saurae]|uniref:Transposase n=1 Tax=Paspalum notatum var. saurae TaxID=547442 RepID=A0AAQ3XA36_PASNO
MTPSESPIGLDPDPVAAFRLCVQFSQFTAKFDDSSFVDMPRKYAEWAVDSRCYKMDSLQKDLATKIKLGSCQQPIVWVYDMDMGGETSLVNDSDLSLALFERQVEKRLHLFVDVQDNFGQSTSLSGSAVTEVVTSNAMSAFGTGQVDGNNQTFVAHVIDWNRIEIAPCLEEQIGAALPVMDEDAMYEFLGLRDEDDRAEQARVAAEIEFEKQHDVDDLNLTDAELAVDDEIPGERSVFYDKEDPPMIVGSIYPSTDEFRAALKQHAIKGQFEVGTEKSCKNRFRGFCRANGCHWAIVARLTQDGKHVRVTLNNKKHFCSSTGRIRTKMASYHWVAEKAIPILKKDPYKGAKQLKQELEDKYNVTLGYSTVWAGRQKAAEHIFGTWEESFAYLYNFKAEVELRMPGSVVEIDVQKKDDGIYFHRFFCCFKASIDGFLNGCRPYLSIDSTALNGRWNGHLPSATAIDGNNWMFPIAFGFFNGETNDNWTWFMQQLQKAIGNPPILAISSDACKAIANAVKAVFPWAEHRECFLH